jgi:hypothetical protein
MMSKDTLGYFRRKDAEMKRKYVPSVDTNILAFSDNMALIYGEMERRKIPFTMDAILNYLQNNIPKYDKECAEFNWTDGKRTNDMKEIMAGDYKHDMEKYGEKYKLYCQCIEYSMNALKLFDHIMNDGIRKDSEIPKPLPYVARWEGIPYELKIQMMIKFYHVVQYLKKNISSIGTLAMQYIFGELSYCADLMFNTRTEYFSYTDPATGWASGDNFATNVGSIFMKQYLNHIMYTDNIFEKYMMSLMQLVDIDIQLKLYELGDQSCSWDSVRTLCNSYARAKICMSANQVYCSYIIKCERYILNRSVPIFQRSRYNETVMRYANHVIPPKNIIGIIFSKIRCGVTGEATDEVNSVDDL